MRLVIIGGGAGGMSAAAAARRAEPKVEIVVLEQTTDVSVGLCGLPYFVSGQIHDPRALIVHTPEYFRSERGIDVRTRHRVEAVQPGQRHLAGRHVDTGEPFELTYDRLIVATGARPLQLGIPGEELPHVFHLRTLEDAIRLRGALERQTARTAAVVGGGFIGLELAEALRHWGLQVTVIEAAARPLSAFDPWVSQYVARELDKHEVKVQTSARLGAIATGELHLASGERAGASLPADLVVVAAGNRPALDILGPARAELGRSGALSTSRQMRTSLPSVWAAGDCADSRHSVTGKPFHIPLGTVANLHGRVAGAAAAGARMESQPLAGTYLLQLFDLTVARTGLSEAEAVAAGFQPVAAAVSGPVHVPALPDAGVFEIGLLADARSGKLLGAQLVGHRDAARRIDTVAALLVRGGTALEAAGLDLGYTPPLSVARDPLVLAAQRLTAKIDRLGRR